MIDEPATEKVAQKIAAPLGVELEKQQRERAGQAIHYAYGALWGGISSLLTARASGLASATGLVFGTGLWLLGDEIIVPARAAAARRLGTACRSMYKRPSRTTAAPAVP